MPYSDLNSFLTALERTGELARVAEPVDPVLEATALARQVQAGSGPALLLENPVGGRMPLLLNLFGHRRRIEAVLAGRALSSLDELGRLLARLHQPRLPGSLREGLRDWPELAQIALTAPHRVRGEPDWGYVAEGPDVDLEALPLQQCWPGDAGRLITLGLVLTHNQRLGRTNIGIYRQQLIGRNR
ncbi:MAG: UbiD family decarboxylase domain-containing protein, partial [Wenzhouxiangella sp.]